jgi:hypothetical protein
MRLSLIAVAMCMAWLAGMASAEARPYYGNGDRMERTHANWSGKRRYSSRHVYAKRQYAQRRYTHRQYSQRGYSHRQYSYRQSSYRKYANRQGYRQGYHRQYAQRRSYGYRRYASTGGSYGAGGRPRAWCGWWMRTQLGGGPEYNLAANWRNYGRSSGPQVGAVVVWPHHVGIITGRSADGRWIVKSGNDGNAVRERAQSVAGAVFRTG